tara:strand:- start:388 stop:657 length:270 start_codon:yes stop_codon:yes gene_type:complete
MIFTKDMIKQVILSDSKQNSTTHSDDLFTRRQKNRLIAEKTDFIINSVQETQNKSNSSVYFAPEELNELKQVLSGYFFNKLSDIGASNV